MSNRFGRNQRRKMRERIQQWETAYRMESGLLRHVVRERDQLKRTLANVECALGKYFVGLPTKTVKMSSDVADHEQLLYRLPISGRFTYEQERLSSERCQALDAWLLHSYLHFDVARCAVHVILSYEGGSQPRVAYMISEVALANIEVTDLVPLIAPMLARALKEGLPSHAARG